MHFSMRITIRIICVSMRIPKHFSKCVSHAHCMRFRNAHYGKRIRSASDAFQKCASWLSHFMRIWKRIWNASVMRIKRFKWNGLMRFQMRINVHRVWCRRAGIIVRNTFWKFFFRFFRKKIGTKSDILNILGFFVILCPFYTKGFY